MNIRKYLVAVLATLGFLSSMVEANPVVARFAAKPGLFQSLVSKAKNTALEISQPVRTDLAIVQESIKRTRLDSHILQPTKRAFEECVPNPTTRNIIKLKACEWIFMSPGFFLAASGDIPMIGGLVTSLMPCGNMGVAAAAVVAAGAASWYPWEFGLKQYDKFKEHIKRPNNTQMSTIHHMNHSI